MSPCVRGARDCARRGDLAAPAGGRDQRPDTVRRSLSGAGWGLIEEAPGQGQGWNNDAQSCCAEQETLGCRLLLPTSLPLQFQALT